MKHFLEKQNEARKAALEDVQAQIQASQSVDEVRALTERAKQIAVEIDETREAIVKFDDLKPVETKSNTPDPAATYRSAPVKEGIGIRAAREFKKGMDVIAKRGVVTFNSEVRAATDPVMSVPALNTEIDTELVTPVKEPLVTDLFTIVPTTSSAITYGVLTRNGGDVAAVAEGGAKPQLSWTTTTRTDAVKKAAGWVEETEEMIEDEPYIAAEIEVDLMYLVDANEIKQVLAGSGTGDEVQGILNREGILTPTYAANATAQEKIDAIFKAARAIKTATGFVADGVVINPDDAAELVLAKDNNSQYLLGGPIYQAYGNGTGQDVNSLPPIWRLNVRESDDIPAGTFLVGAFKRSAKILRRKGTTVAAGYINDQFTKDKMTLRAEKRFALQVKYPGGFAKLTAAAAG
jgi:hypothetical protein